MLLHLKTHSWSGRHRTVGRERYRLISCRTERDLLLLGGPFLSIFRKRGLPATGVFCDLSF